jgi:hypothetical protein
VTRLALAAIEIAVLQETGIEVEALLESGHQLEIQRARTIDLAARVREIAAVEIELGVGTWEAVLEIGVGLATAPATVVVAHVRAAAEVLPAWAVRAEGALAERPAAVAAVVAVVAAVVVVAVVEDKKDENVIARTSRIEWSSLICLQLAFATSSALLRGCRNFNVAVAHQAGNSNGGFALFTHEGTARIPI